MGNYKRYYGNDDTVTSLQLNAIIGTVTASTKQSGNEIGNFIKSSLPRLVGKPAQSALSSLGVNLTDDSGNLRDIIQVYTEVAEKVKGISDSERIAVVEGLAGVKICPYVVNLEI